MSKLDPVTEERARMVREQIEARGLHAEGMVAAMRKVPRHAFVPEFIRKHAYEDRPLSIAEGQTISQPYMVALMSSLSGAGHGSRVLEVGTGSGYQSAVLAELGAKVDSVEINPRLAKEARNRLQELGYRTVQVHEGDGYHGWPASAPFDAIIVTAAAPRVPKMLLQQLALHGKMVIPVGEEMQYLLLLRRTAEDYAREEIIPVRFVPMIGKIQVATD